MVPAKKFVVGLVLAAGVSGFVMAASRASDSDVAGSPDTAATDLADDASTVASSAPDQAMDDALGGLLPVEQYESTGQTAAEAIAAHENATEGPEQPIPFNHRFHVREIGMQCAYCHDGVQVSPMAPIPSVDLCMGCHRIVGSQHEAIQDLRGYYERGEPVPWERVYKVPDFAHFPHNAHLRNEIACSECHGPVEDMDRVYKYSSLKMGWCLACHMGEGQETDYATYRTLVEKYPPPQPPEGGQPVGLYPRTIDQQYAANRGPIDCTACHY